ncbi:hypothetical protein HELRODRAFT_173933 [Helobdella robusta]|uniref:Apple domain-containing protein n=1 Tax=Helobdella robusta TaxID=6412 RepID=T1F7E3_HELRO|nr:hypothetical protein HELRODRAFT_173933 [Helobdella robusta]ESO03059.1 hypothetical protein HELRODRAFT_173933 [Helobdella robusta]
MMSRIFRSIPSSSFDYVSLVIFVVALVGYHGWICQARCFVRRLNCKQKDECCCDEPSMQTTFNDIPSSRAFVSCSWICSNNSLCLAFNFNQNFNTCQLFFIDRLKCFQEMVGCLHMHRPGVFYRNLTINADDQIVSLYFDGVPQKSLSFWKNYAVFDTHLMAFGTKVIAVRAANLNTGKSIVAYSDDGYILTNTTWRCSSAIPKLDSKNNSWYDANYNDQRWPLAINQDPKFNLNGALKIWSDNFTDAFCRKNICG